MSDKAVAGSICRHDTGTQSIMNGCNVYDGRNHIFAAGLDDECHIYSLKYKVTSPEKKDKGLLLNQDYKTFHVAEIGDNLLHVLVNSFNKCFDFRSRKQ
jgi:hypothetical protein